MASILALPPSTPPQHSNASDGNPPDSRASSPGNDDPMRVESVPRGSTSQTPPELTNSEGGNRMQVDEPEVTEPTLQCTAREIKPINHALMMQSVAPVPPSQKPKAKQQKKASSNFRTEISTSHPRPVVIGSKYVKISFINLMQIEVSIISLLYLKHCIYHRLPAFISHPRALSNCCGT